MVLAITDFSLISFVIVYCYCALFYIFFISAKQAIKEKQNTHAWQVGQIVGQTHPSYKNEHPLVLP